MRKAILGLVASLALAIAIAPAYGQVNAFITGGRVLAQAFGLYQARTTNAISSGSQTIQVDRCYAAAGNGIGVNFIPWAVNVPIAIVDSNSETVTPTAVTTPTAGSTTGCSVTATFGSAHGAGATVTSGDGGLGEAMVYIKGTGGVITLDPTWQGTTAQISGAAISALAQSNIVVEDIRGYPVQYWQLKPTAVTQIAAPSAPTVGVLSGSLSSGVYLAKVAYVDALGGVGLASTDSSATASTTGLSITAPAASTGAVGWLPYITAAGGSAGTEILAKAIIDSTICPLSSLSPIPSCAMGSAATITAANPSSTSKPVVESTAFTTYAYVPSPKMQPVFNMSYPFGVYVVGGTLNSGGTANLDLAQFQVPAGYLNVLGKTVRICVKGATATQVAASTLTYALTVSNSYAQSPVTLASEAFGTYTQGAGGTQSGCWELQTAVTGATGKFWVMNDGPFYNILNSAVTTFTGATVEVSAAASSAVDLTKPLWFAINAADGTANNITGPIVNSVSITEVQ